MSGVKASEVNTKKFDKLVTVGVFILLATNSPDSDAHGASDFMARGYQAGFSFYFGVPFCIRLIIIGLIFINPFITRPYQVPALFPGYIESQKYPPYGEQNRFYCPGADSYYPRVTDCPEGWQTVSLCSD
ncbi:hypothetical protein [Methylomicrobium sp. Wu6]|uniref:hypothetical protein n=1 Tax=Methylomicrobium sp. Wu6 TaxID=3107928 RepID=UPI002DD6A8E8|nr:hypothetical protein [Methylomicrobium sp. Wu6]MEC4749006.1 hypothetical protein [Methylomicrobium sp. Wu6]